MHGNSRRRLSIFGTQLREKQKIKRTYGLFEKPFRNYFDAAVREQGITGEVPEAGRRQPGLPLLTH